MAADILSLLVSNYDIHIQNKGSYVVKDNPIFTVQNIKIWKIKAISWYYMYKNSDKFFLFDIYENESTKQFG